MKDILLTLVLFVAAALYFASGVFMVIEDSNTSNIVSTFATAVVYTIMFGTMIYRLVKKLSSDDCSFFRR